MIKLIICKNCNISNKEKSFKSKLMDVLTKDYKKGVKMKLIMKADDGKEIVYISENDYDVGYIEDHPDDLFIMINNLSPEKRKYLSEFFEFGDDSDFNSFIKKNDFVLETPDFYFLFSNNVCDEIQNITKNNAIVRIGFISLENKNITIGAEIGTITKVNI